MSVGCRGFVRGREHVPGVAAARGSSKRGLGGRDADVVEPDEDGVACAGVAFPVGGGGGDGPAVGCAERGEVGGGEVGPLLDVEGQGNGAERPADLLEPDSVTRADEPEHAGPDDGEPGLDGLFSLEYEVDVSWEQDGGVIAHAGV